MVLQSVRFKLSKRSRTIFRANRCVIDIAIEELTKIAIYGKEMR